MALYQIDTPVGLLEIDHEGDPAELEGAVNEWVTSRSTPAAKAQPDPAPVTQAPVPEPASSGFADAMDVMPMEGGLSPFMQRATAKARDEQLGENPTLSQVAKAAALTPAFPIPSIPQQPTSSIPVATREISAEDSAAMDAFAAAQGLPLPSIARAQATSNAPAQVAAGVANTVVGAGNFMATPVGGAMSMIGEAPVIAQKLVSAGFGADMIHANAPRVLTEPTLQGKVEAGLGAAMGATALVHGAGRVRTEPVVATEAQAAIPEPPVVTAARDAGLEHTAAALNGKPVAVVPDPVAPLSQEALATTVPARGTAAGISGETTALDNPAPDIAATRASEVAEPARTEPAPQPQSERVQQSETTSQPTTKNEPAQKAESVQPLQESESRVPVPKTDPVRDPATATESADRVRSDPEAVVESSSPAESAQTPTKPQTEPVPAPPAGGLLSAKEAADILASHRTSAVEAARRAGAADPESAAQTAWAKLTVEASEGKVDLTDNPGALFAAAAKQEAINEYRKASTQKAGGGTEKVSLDAETEQGTPVSELVAAPGGSDSVIRDVRTVVMELPDEQRSVVEHILDGKTQREIADELGISPREVEKRYAKAKAEMKRKLGPGAANIEEPLAVYEERSFGKRFQEDESIAQEIRDETGNRYYEPIPNKLTVGESEAIIDKRGLDESVRLVRDESASMEPRVRSTLGQSLIKKLNKAYNKAKEAGDTALSERHLSDAVDTAEFLSEYGTRLGQGVQAFAVWSRLTPEGMLLSAKRAMAKSRERTKKLKPKTPEDKLPNLTPEDEAKILELGQKINDAPDGLPKDKATFELNKFLATKKGFDIIDLPIGVMYGNILSGYNTHIVNALDTFLNVSSEVSGLALANPRAASTIMRGMMRGLGEGKLDAQMALTEGRMATDGKWLEAPRLMEIAKFGEKGGVPIKDTGTLSRIGKRVAESKIAVPLNAYKYVTRLLAASDAVMFRSAKEARAALLAHRIAEAEGLKGDALMTRQFEILGSDKISDFRAQAAREGFTGKEAEVRAAELRDMTRPKDLSSDAADFAGEATYNHDPHGMLGYLAGGISKASTEYPVFKLFVPFTRIVANVTNRGLNWTPYGYKRAFFGYSKGEPLSLEARNQMLIRATAGTAGLVALGGMQAGGLLTVHGGGPSDKERRKQLQASGWRPYTIQIGDTYLSYAYTPVGLGLSVLGNMSDAERYHELKQRDAATRAAYAVTRIPATVFSQSFLSGLSRLFGALSNSPGESITAVKQSLSSTVGAFTNPAIVKDIQRLFDPKTYESNDIAGDLIKNTPFAALALNPALNAFGEPVNLQRQRFIGIKTKDEVWKTVVDTGIRVPVPSRQIETKKGVRITPAQYYELLKRSGPDIKAWIEKKDAHLRSITTDAAQDELDSAAQEIRQKHLEKIKKGG